MGIVTDSAVGVWLDFFTCFILNPKHQCKLNQKLSRRLCAQLCNKWGYQGLHTYQCIKRSGEQHQQPDIPGTFVPENICLCLGLLFLGHDFPVLVTKYEMIKRLISLVTEVASPLFPIIAQSIEPDTSYALKEMTTEERVPTYHPKHKGYSCLRTK